MKTNKVVIAGGPGTGKTSIINHLKDMGYMCFDEISRQVTLEARKEGIEQLFITDPLLFSKKLLQGRIDQFEAAKKATADLVFFDRGVPDVLAYMDYIGDTYPEVFIEAAKNYTYNFVFMLAPWEAIFTSDNERYENYEQALKIHNYLVKTYKFYGYHLIDVPFLSVEERASFILNALNQPDASH